MTRDDYVVLFNGTKDAPLGRLLFPPLLPEQVRVRRPVIAPCVAPVAPPPRLRTPREQRRDDARGGPVHDAKDRIWALLEFPRTARDITEALDLSENAVASMLVRGHRAGIVVLSGHRKNEQRGRGVKLWSQLYVRAKEHARAPAWPHVRQTRAERRAANVMREAARNALDCTFSKGEPCR